MLETERVIPGRSAPARAASAPLDDPRVLGQDRSAALGHAQALGDELERAWTSYRLPAQELAPGGRVLFGGMGGSGIAGDYCVAALERSDRALALAQCTLPRDLTAEDVVVLTSYSGNTEEASRAFDVARERGARAIVVASGGRLLERAIATGAPHVAVTYRSAPRAALAHLLAANLRVAGSLGQLPGGDALVAEAAAGFRRVAGPLAPGVATGLNPAKRLSLLIRGRLPVIVAAGHLVPCGQRWKTQLAENAKRLAVAERIPDLLHNTVEALGAQQPAITPLAIILDSPRYAAEDRRHISQLRSFLGRHEILTVDIAVEGTSVLADLLEATAWADHVSLYAALATGIDPTPIPAIDELKGGRTRLAAAV